MLGREQGQSASSTHSPCSQLFQQGINTRNVAWPENTRVATYLWNSAVLGHGEASFTGGP